MITTYKSTKYNEATMYFPVMGQNKKVEFKGGYVFMGRPSKFTTSDPMLQIAMERDPRFGKDYVIAEQVRQPIDDKIDEIKKANNEEPDVKPKKKSVKK